MAYNGGATTGSIDVIQTTDNWDEASLGVLAAMDKIGMTISSPFWGWMLREHSAKKLLVGGLGLNAGATLVFGFVRNHGIMLFAKLIMGFTEGLQWVWCVVWIVKNAPGSALFLNLNGVSSGVGTMVGIAVAGFGTAHGLSYNFAFQVEGAVLLALWCGLMAIGRERLTVQESAETSKASTTAQSGNCKEQVMGLLRNRLYRNTATAFAAAQYVMLGANFLWVRIFMSIWGDSKDLATFTLMLLPSIGCAVGGIGGSLWKFDTFESRAWTLHCIVYAAALAVVGAAVATAAMYMQIHGESQMAVTRYMVYGGFLCVFAGITAPLGAVVGVCTVSVEEEDMRGIAVGFQQGLNNFLGLSLSPLVPQLVMSMVEPLLAHEGKTKHLYFAGSLANLSGTILLLVCAVLAQRAHKKLRQGNGSTAALLGGI